MLPAPAARLPRLPGGTRRRGARSPEPDNSRSCAFRPWLHGGIYFAGCDSFGAWFLALGVSVARVRLWLQSAGRITAFLQPVSGALLVVMGVLLVSDRWLPLISPVLAWYATAHWPPI